VVGACGSESAEVLIPTAPRFILKLHVAAPTTFRSNGRSSTHMHDWKHVAQIWIENRSLQEDNSIPRVFPQTFSSGSRRIADESTSVSMADVAVSICRVC